MSSNDLKSSPAHVKFNAADQSQILTALVYNADEHPAHDFMTEMSILHVQYSKADSISWSIPETGTRCNKWLC